MSFATMEGFSGGSDGKESLCNVGDPGWERSPGDVNGNPIPVFLLGECHGQRSLAGHSPQGCKESDTSEQLTQQHSRDYHIK